MAETRAEFFELYPDMICVASFDGHLRDLNSKWESTLGWSRTKFESDKIFEFIHREDLANFQLLFSKATSDRSRIFIDCRVRHRDGSWKFLFFSVAQSPDGCFLVVSAREKTEWRREGDEFANSKRQLEAVFSSMREGVVVQAATGEMIQHNPRALEIVGVTADQLMGRTPFDSQWRAVESNGETLAPENHPASIALSTHKAQLDYPMGFQRPGGETRWIRLSAIPLFQSGAEKPYQVIMTFTDETDERNARIKLQTKEHELSRVLNTMPALISYWGADRRLVFCNERYAAVRNKKPADVIGDEIQTTIGEDVYLQAKEHIDGALLGIAANFEIKIPYPDSVVRYLLAVYLPDVRDGKVVGFYSVSTDISRFKELELSRRDLEAKFISASKMSALGEMAAGIAHEINNPLAIINGKTTLLQQRIERGLYEELKFLEDLKSIGSTVDRIAKTVRGLLSFARHSDQEEAKVTNIQKVIETTLDLCREKLRNRGVELRLRLGSNIDVKCHSHQVSQILMNLLNNSNDAIFALEDPWIAVDVDTDPSKIWIRITDSGPRIPDSVAEKLMNPFFTTKEIGKGTGLGLSISKGLAESQGGTLTFDRLHANTSFVLELPLTGSPSIQTRKAG